MPFVDPLMLVAVLEDGRYQLTLDLVYRGRDDTLTVPEGFVTDFASVPRFLTALVPIAGRWDRAAVVHDWLCVGLENGHRGDRPAVACPVDVDGIFRRILRELDVPVILRWLLWCGVRWGALANPARRAGWIRTAPSVLAVSAAAVPFVAPVTVVTLLALGCGAAAQAAANIVGRLR